MTRGSPPLSRSSPQLDLLLSVFGLSCSDTALFISDPVNAGSSASFRFFARVGAVLLAFGSGHSESPPPSKSWPQTDTSLSALCEANSELSSSSRFFACTGSGSPASAQSYLSSLSSPRNFAHCDSPVTPFRSCAQWSWFVWSC